MAGDREESKIPITTVVGLAVALATLWLVREPLQSSRPEVEATAGREAETIQARLWQDPIEAAELHQQTNRLEHPHHYHDLGDIRFKENYGADIKHIGVLIVITEGSPYAENHEKRLRDRYAVLSALGVACFVPADEEHIGYFSFQQDLVPFEWYKARKTRQCHLDEEYTQHYDRVLLVWAKDDTLGEKPLNRLSNMSWLLANQYVIDVCGQLRSLNCLSQLEFKVIGPPNSSMLRAMLENIRDPFAPKWWPNIRPVRDHAPFTIRLYSPWASASPQLLLEKLDKSLPPCDSTLLCAQAVKTRLAEAGVVLEHTVETDEELAIALVGELKRRQVKIGEDPIALIGEWDTFYGRALPITFRAAACYVADRKFIRSPVIEVDNINNERQTNDGRRVVLQKPFEECQSISRAIRFQVEHPEAWEALDMRIHRYSYLRGLDGLTPGDSKKNRATDNGKNGSGLNLNDKKPKTKSVEELERPDGQSQLDYLRRLVAKMKQDADAVSGFIGKPPKAIGVLGSDVYDTLLILKAVREKFPNAIFFTTNLDARLLQESEAKWTRNLVIASPFGLNLHNHIQHDIPPFRDSYQTSGFFSVLRALGHVRFPPDASVAKVWCEETKSKVEIASDHYEIDLTEYKFSSRTCPRLFEIGRHGPVNLSADKGTVSKVLDQLEPIQPARNKLAPPGMRPWWQLPAQNYRLGFRETVFWIGVAILVGLIVFTRLPGKIWNWTRSDIARRDIWFRFLNWIWIEVAGSSTWLGIVITLTMAIIGVITGVVAVNSLIPVILRDDWEGESFSLFDGVSTWPSIAIRSLVIVWCFRCLVKAFYDLRLTQKELSEEFGFHFHGSERTSEEQGSWYHRSIAWIQSVPQKSDSVVNANDIWRDYSRAALYRNRIARSVMLLVVYMFLISIILATIASPGLPSSPCRGSINCAMAHGVTFAAVLSMVLLNMFVFDAVLLCQGFIARLNATPIYWPHGTLSKYHSQFNIDHQYLPSFIVVRFIANQTQAVHNLVFCPFIALFFMIVSRNRFFDNWDFPLALIIVWLLYTGLAAGSTIILRFRAKEAREIALSRLCEQRVHVTGMGEQGKAQAEQIRLMINEINHVRKGAYAPLALHPVFSASILALISFLQYWYVGQ